MKIRKSLFPLVLAMLVASCSGGGSSNDSSGQITSEVEASTEPEDLSTIIHDKFSLTDYYGAFSASNLSTQEPVSYFEVEKDAVIQKIEWLGLARGLNSESTQATFIVRIYQGTIWPWSRHSYELVTQASVTVGRRHNGKNVYHFTIEGDDLFNLQAGSYWITLLEPQTEMIEFFWEWEPFDGGRWSSGGAIRYFNPATAWDASNNDARSDEGYMLKITGRDADS